jgi:hypothetical protein
MLFTECLIIKLVAILLCQDRSKCTLIINLIWGEILRSPNSIKITVENAMDWHVTRMGEIRKKCRILVGKSEETR